MLGVQEAAHFFLFDDQHGGGRNGGGGRDAQSLAGQTAFAEKVTWSEHRNDCFFASLIYYGEPHAALLDINDGPFPSRPGRKPFPSF